MTMFSVSTLRQFIVFCLFWLQCAGWLAAQSGGSSPADDSDSPPPLSYGVLKSVQVLVVGRMMEAREAPEVKAYIRPSAGYVRKGFFKGKVYTIAVDEVFKGQGISPGDTLPLLVLIKAIGKAAPPPEERARLQAEWAARHTQWQVERLRTNLRRVQGIEDLPDPPETPPPAWLEEKLTEAEILEYYQHTGDFPPNTSDTFMGNGLDFQVGKPFVFALFIRTPDFVDPNRSTYWVGLQEFAADSQLYGPSFDYEISDDQIEIEVLRRYVQILNVKNPDQQVRLLAQYSMQLLRDRGLPQKVTFGAVENLGGFHSDWQWGKVTQRLGEPPDEKVIVVPGWRFTAHYLTRDERQELLGTLSDRSRSLEFRQRLMHMFFPAIMYRKSGDEMRNVISVSELDDSVRVKRFDYGIDPFLQILQDPSEELDFRHDALRVLGEVGGPEVEDALRRILLQKPVDETEEEIHRMVEYTLSTLQNGGQ